MEYILRYVVYSFGSVVVVANIAGRDSSVGRASGFGPQGHGLKSASTSYSGSDIAWSLQL